MEGAAAADDDDDAKGAGSRQTAGYCFPCAYARCLCMRHSLQWRVGNENDFSQQLLYRYAEQIENRNSVILFKKQEAVSVRDARVHNVVNDNDVDDDDDDDDGSPSLAFD